MTISHKIHVNGDYKATVVHSVDGKEDSTTVIIGTGEKQLPFRGGKLNSFTIEEKALTKTEIAERDSHKTDPNATIVT